MATLPLLLGLLIVINLVLLLWIFLYQRSRPSQVVGLEVLVERSNGLQKALNESIAKLPIPKVMTYQLSPCFRWRKRHHLPEMVHLPAPGFFSQRQTYCCQIRSVTSMRSLASANGPRASG